MADPGRPGPMESTAGFVRKAGALTGPGERPGRDGDAPVLLEWKAARVN